MGGTCWPCGASAVVRFRPSGHRLEAATVQRLADAERTFDPETCVTNLQARFDETGSSAAVPDITQAWDTDEDGLANALDPDDDGDGVADIDDCAPLDPSEGAGGCNRWSKQFGDAQPQSGASVALDGSDNVLLTGHFWGTADFGAGGPLTSAGADDIFVTTLDSGGGHLWSKRFGDADSQIAASVAVDDSGNALLTGYFWGMVDFGGGPLASTGQSDVFVAKLDANGNHLWSKRFGDAAFQVGASVAVDGSDNVLLTGFFGGTVDFGAGPLTSAGLDQSADIFVAKLDPTGGHLWSKRFGDADAQEGDSIALDCSVNVLLTGFFAGTVDFGGSVLASNGEYDGFVAKLGP